MAENQNSVGPHREKEEKRDKEESKEEEEEEQNKVEELLQNSLSSSTEQFNFSSVFTDQNSKLKTLAVESSSILTADNDQDSDSLSFSQLLNASMVSPSVDSTPLLSVSCELDENQTVSTLPEESNNNKEEFGMSRQEVVETITSEDHNHTLDEYPLSSMDLAPASFIQSTSSTSSLVSRQQTVPAIQVDNSNYEPVFHEKKSFDQKVEPAQVVPRTPTPDRFNWRKYGQKQVKSTESSRSYYRCTHVNCHAKKKIEHCDHSNSVVEIIYKGRHNHDPPRSTRCTKGRRGISFAGTGGESSKIDHPLQRLKTSDTSKSRKQTEHVTPKQQVDSTSKYDDSVRIKAEEEQDDEPIRKRKKDERNLSYAIPLSKTFKESKIVVQAAVDIGISSDGYRWRKYGQKMVKGNPNPRSYYKCTSAGCPVRKHVERATDDITAVIITYEGKHDHDMPVPKKHQPPPSAALLIAAAGAASSGSTSQPKKYDNLATQESNDKSTRGQKPLKLGSEKVLESTRTLLSIGIELKPY